MKDPTAVEHTARMLGTHAHKNKTGGKERATHFMVGTNELNFLVFLESVGFVVLKLLLIERSAFTSASAKLYMEIMKFYPRIFILWICVHYCTVYSTQTHVYTHHYT